MTTTLSLLSWFRRSLLAATVSLLAFTATGLRSAEPFEDVLEKANLDYAHRIEQATNDLAKVRARIDAEKAPLLRAMRAAEDRAIAAETDLTRLAVPKEELQENRRRLLKDFDALRKNGSYMDTLANDTLRSLQSGGLPLGAGKDLIDRLNQIQAGLDRNTGTSSGAACVDVAQFLLDDLRTSLGGYATGGSAVLNGNRELRKGTYIHVGPETFFVPEGAEGAGTVRSREGFEVPVVFPVKGWGRERSQALLQGQFAVVATDSSGGKALKLTETKGTFWDHINKGGIIAYVILAVGCVSLLMILQKAREIAGMRVDSPARVTEFMRVLGSGGAERAQAALGKLGPCTREIFARGLETLSEPREAIEEHLYAVLLRQRLHFEKRLPLLAVIATAAPLMGLLGTVMGMVKTFALITVFGTGNAGKLASGISEVLVATELGLMVAIPTLIAHGFLAHRVQTNLAALERYALEFVGVAQGREPSEKPLEIDR